MSGRRAGLLLWLLLVWIGPAASSEIRGVWMTANDMPVLRDRTRMQTALDDLAARNFNTVYVVVWNNAMAYYPSGVVQQRRLQDFELRGLQGQDVLAEVADAARARGLLVIPWFEFGFMVPLDSDLARRHPDWLTQTRSGGRTSISAAGEVAWLNPFRPEVQQLITDLVLEVISSYPVDGIQFDDHMSLPRAFGYDPYTTALYRKETGRLPPADDADPVWVQWRATKITAFMKRLKQAVRAIQPAALFSISPNYYDFAYKLQLQDWLSWVRQGIADELLIQIYRPDLDSFLPHLTRPEVIESRGRIPTAIAVMSGQRNRPAPLDLVLAQSRAARNNGLGVAFFYYESLWDLDPTTASERRAALAELFAQPAVRQLNGMVPSLPPVPPPPPSP
jgi:uncharacterized lipoprotein YddW (UPF0748 family)